MAKGDVHFNLLYNASRLREASLSLPKLLDILNPFLAKDYIRRAEKAQARSRRNQPRKRKHGRQ